MGGILGGGNASTAQTPEKLATVQVSTSCYGHPKPLVYGTTRIACNMIDYDAFTATQTTSGGKGGGGGVTGYTYTADLILALCEGGASGIADVLRVWQDKDCYNLSHYGLSLLKGPRPQSPWSAWQSKYPGKALGYAGTAYVGGIKISLGSGGSVPNYNFEVKALLATEVDPGGNGWDAKPSAVLVDALTNPFYGAGFLASRVSDLVSGADSFQTYCTACGFAVSPAWTDQQDAAAAIQQVLDATNSELVWACQILSYRGVWAGGTSYAVGDVVAYPSAGTYYTCGTANSDSSWTAGHWTLTASPAAGMVLKIVPYGDTPITANGATYTPNTTPLYDLTFDDFLGAVGKDGKPTGTDPIAIQRSSTQDVKNDVPVEYCDRSDSYNVSIVDTPEPADVSLNGLKQDSSITLHLITRAAHAQQISLLRAQRNVWLRNTYTFKLGWKYLLLEPMDLVTLSDPITGLNRKIVRIVSVEMPEETSEEDGLTVTAEEWPVGVGSATLYKTQNALGNSAATNPAPPVEASVIFEPPVFMTASNRPEIWIGAAGAPSQWGGANVWISTDGGNSYGSGPVGTINNSARIGYLSSALPVGSDPDTTDTVAVDLSPSQGALNGTSAAGLNSFATACLVGSGEIIAYQNEAIQTGSNPYAYNLTTLRRGAYGSLIDSHVVGDRFMFLGTRSKSHGSAVDGILKLPYDSSLVGKTLYVKLQSFNMKGSGLQDLSACTAYGYTPVGTKFPAPPIVTVTQSATNSSGSGSSTSASAGVTVTSSGGLTTAAIVWLTITWTWPGNFPTPTGFNVVAFTGSDPTVAANYLFDMVSVGPNTLSVTIAVTPTSTMSVVNAAVEAVYA